MQRRVGPQFGVVWLVRSRAGFGEAGVSWIELGPALLTAPRSPGRRGGVAGGVGGSEPGPEGPARSSSRRVLPSTG